MKVSCIVRRAACLVLIAMVFSGCATKQFSANVGPSRMDSYSIYLTTLKLDHGVNDTSTLFDRLRDHLSDELTKQGFAGASSSLDQYYWVDVDVGENPLRFWHFGIQLAPTPQDGGGIAVILREASDMRGPKYAPQPDELGANLRSKLKAAFQAAVSPGM